MGDREGGDRAIAQVEFDVTWVRMPIKEAVGHQKEGR